MIKDTELKTTLKTLVHAVLRYLNDPNREEPRQALLESLKRLDEHGRGVGGRNLGLAGRQRRSRGPEMSRFSVLLLSVLTFAATGAVAAPACRYITPTCDSLNGQMQEIYAPRPDNNFGRVEDFYRIDHNRWLNASTPKIRAPLNAEALRTGTDQEAEYRRGQAYASLSAQDKWQVLRARKPEDRIWRLAGPRIREQVERESAFFQGLSNDVYRIAYMSLTPAQRRRAATMADGNEAEEFILANAGAFVVVAYQVDRNDILKHLMPVTAQPLLFPNL